MELAARSSSECTSLLPPARSAPRSGKPQTASRFAWAAVLQWPGRTHWLFLLSHKTRYATLSNLELELVELLLVFTFDIQGSNFSELVGKGKSVRRAWCGASLHGYAPYAMVVACSIGCLSFFVPCDIQVEPGVQSFKSDLDTAVRRLTFF